MCPSTQINFRNFTPQISMALYGDRASTPTSSSFSLDDAEQTQLQIIHSKRLKPVESGSEP